MKSVEYKNKLVYYRVFGNGSPLVFLHGFLEESSMWDEFVKPFSKNHQIILIDLPCHGKSRFDGDICSMTYMANAVDIVLNEENIENPYVFGHSMGGYVGLELIKLRPIKLTLVHSNFWADSPTQREDRDRVVELVQDRQAFFINVAIPNLFYINNRVKCADAINEVIEKANLIPKNEICAGTLGLKTRNKNFEVMENYDINIIQGEYDTIMSLEEMKKSINQLAKPQNFKVIKDCGHMGIWEQTDTLTQIIDEIINN